ncbi:MAG: hypothetical protein EAZ42_00500 [Verrucomicrobia bacterium]|nr:MAG: hypothetical protein EAZ42_00500 [Verrucomicrobiota bacterium]
MRFDFCFPPALLGWVHDKNVSSRCEFGVASVPEGSEAISCIEAARRHDSADTFFRPKLPDCLQRWPMTLQHPASATPELKRFNTAAYAVHREPPQLVRRSFSVGGYQKKPTSNSRSQIKPPVPPHIILTLKILRSQW